MDRSSASSPSVSGISGFRHGPIDRPDRFTAAFTAALYTWLGLEMKANTGSIFAHNADMDFVSYYFGFWQHLGSTEHVQVAPAIENSAAFRPLTIGAEG